MLINTLATAVAPETDARLDAAMVFGVTTAFAADTVTRPLAGFGPGAVQGSTVQNSTVQNSTVQNSTVQNSTVQHDTNQMIRLYPATRGGVGPHPAREPVPV
jgi:hypothetical protein